jgi:hypothetical protein
MVCVWLKVAIILCIQDAALISSAPKACEAKKAKTENAPLPIPQPNLQLRRRQFPIHLKHRLGRDARPTRKPPSSRARSTPRSKRAGHRRGGRGGGGGEGRDRAETVTGAGEGTTGGRRLTDPLFVAAFGDLELDGLVVLDFEEGEGGATRCG